MSLLIVGLGNPGREYEETRHNIGQMVVEKLADEYNGFWKEKFKGQYCKISGPKGDVYLLVPHTYMNLSGESVQALAKFFKIQVNDILVAHDELDLPFGQINFKDGGGLAGHNGLKSMKQCLGNQNFKRLRMGIGRPQHGQVSDWVLSKFRGDEVIVLEQVLDLSILALKEYMDKGLPKAANKFSKAQVEGLTNKK